jgi:hypothetical protein
MQTGRWNPCIAICACSAGGIPVLTGESIPLPVDHPRLLVHMAAQCTEPRKLKTASRSCRDIPFELCLELQTDDVGDPPRGEESDAERRLRQCGRAARPLHEGLAEDMHIIEPVGLAQGARTGATVSKPKTTAQSAACAVGGGRHAGGPDTMCTELANGGVAVGMRGV